MMVARTLLLAGIVVLYGWFFTLQEQKGDERKGSLPMAMPVGVYKIAGGYMQQLAAEMLFIRTSVFLGSVEPGSPSASYVDALGHNFEVMTRLYPRFIDPYYFCQGFLAPISPEAAARTNTIFETGIAAYPGDLILRFFHGTNFFLAMNEPLKGAAAFTEAAKLPEAPPLFGHLAALLSAKGGEIAAGLLSLKTMLASEKDEMVRTRYQEEIIIFEEALGVQKAIDLYAKRYNTVPMVLDQLVPEFLPKLPEKNDYFTLVYDPPIVRLQRPDKTKKEEKTGVPWK